MRIVSVNEHADYTAGRHRYSSTTPSRSALHAVAGDRAQHDQHDWRGAVHHDPTAYVGHGRTTGDAGVDRRARDRDLRWDGVDLGGRRIIKKKRIVPLPARSFRTGACRPVDGVT